jgi:hypothetical protein
MHFLSPEINQILFKLPIEVIPLGGGGMEGECAGDGGARHRMIRDVFII